MKNKKRHLTLNLSLAALLGGALSGCGGGSSSPGATGPNIPPPGKTDPPSDSPKPPQARLFQETVDLPSKAKPPYTPGTPGVEVVSESLIKQFGGTDIDLNKIRYVRYALPEQKTKQPDAVFIAIPGFLGGAHNFRILAENVMLRARDQHQLIVEVWAVDRRSNFLEDTVGLDLAEAKNDPRIALDFLYGEELGLELDPDLQAGPNRRAVFHEQRDLAFMANWTPLVHSMDIDAVVEKAHKVVRNGNVFLGGHSAGTGYTARYAATDFNLSGTGVAEPGYKKLRGLILLEGAGEAVATEAPTEEALDAIEAAYDGGYYHAVLNGLASAYAVLPGLTPRTSASTELTGLQIAAEGDLNASQALLQQDQGGISGNNVYERLDDFSPRPFGVTPGAALGTFFDDDAYSEPNFVAASIGAPGPQKNGLLTWLDNDTDLPPEVFADNGPAPVTGPPQAWGTEAEPSNLKRMVPMLYKGGSNYSEWYYGATGLSIGSGLGLDTSALSIGRGRTDIANQTQAAHIDIPVIAFGGSNGLVTVPAAFLGFARSIDICLQPSCDNTTARIIATGGNFPTFGGIAGGFEVYMSEGYSHMDVLTANDDGTNNVVAPLVAFIERNLR